MDQYGTRAQVDVVADRVPAPVEVVMLPDCRHSPFIDQPERTLQLVGGFVRGVAGHLRPGQPAAAALQPI